MFLDKILIIIINFNTMSNFTISKEEHIKYIIDNFDFHKVNKVMISLCWTWAGSINSPNIDELKQKATELLNDICDDDDHINFSLIGSGGFNAIRYRDHCNF